MKLQLLKWRTWEYPSHSMVGRNLYWGSVYTMDSEECFESGVNVLVGGITQGGWALTHSLANPRHSFKREVEIKLDGKRCSLRKLDYLSFYVGNMEKKFYQKRTAKKIFSKFTRNWGKERVSKLLKEFGIDEDADSYCKQPICSSGKDIWKYSVVLGVLMKKKIFLFPWFSQQNLQEIKDDVVKIGIALKKRNLIVLLPTENDAIFRTTALEYERCILTQVCGERMEREQVN